MRKKFAVFLILTVLILGMAVMATAWFARDDTPTGGPSPTPVATAVAATPQPNSVQVAPSAPPQRTHTVQAGDTLFSIARTYGITVDELAAANALVDPNLLFAGQVLTIPGQVVETVVGETAVPANTPSASLPSPAAAAAQTQAQPISAPAAVSVNGLPATSILLMDDAARQNARNIFQRGQALGRNPRAYAKVGDSTTENPFFMARFDGGAYNLGDYAYLQGAIDHFVGSHARDSVAVRVGLHAWSLFDPVWAEKDVCQMQEGPFACELRIHNPSIVIIRLGSNDAGAPTLFEESVRQAVEYAIDSGVIPVIGTKADRGEGSNANNEILRQIAADYQLPLWDFDSVAGTIPGRGLDADGIHMTTFYAHDYTQPEAFQRGHSMHNLSALIALDTIWKEVILASG